MTDTDDQKLPPSGGDEQPSTDPRPRRTARPPRKRSSPGTVASPAAEESGVAAEAREPSPAPPPEPARARAPRERSPRAADEREPARERAPRERPSRNAEDRDRAPRERAARDEDRDRAPRERPLREPEDREPDLDRESDPRFSRGPRPAIYRRAFPAEHLDEDAVRVVKRLVRNGFHAYLVGGGVRDLLLGRKPKDFDIATNARPHDIKSIFRNCRVIGRRFRLAHILFGGGKVIETATFRRDPSAGEFEVELDAAEEPLVPRAKSREDDADLLIRHDNVFGDPHEDALRRDFRINGLFYDMERQEVIDFVGGMKDVEARVVSTIGLPDVRFREDPVRILRAIKFSARLDIGIDPECYDAMVAQREELRKAAKARLFEEILRLLRGGAAQRSIWLTWEMGVLAVLVPQVSTMLDDDAQRTRELWRRLDAIDAVVAQGRVPSDTVLVSVLLTGAIEEALDGARDALEAYEELMSEVTELLSLPRRIKERMRVVIGCQRRLRSGKVGTLPQREFWRDALDLYEIECMARGVEPLPLAAEPVPARAAAGPASSHAPVDLSDDEAGRRRRRRKRR